MLRGRASCWGRRRSPLRTPATKLAKAAVSYRDHRQAMVDLRPLWSSDGAGAGGALPDCGRTRRPAGVLHCLGAKKPGRQLLKRYRLSDGRPATSARALDPPGLSAGISSSTLFLSKRNHQDKALRNLANLGGRAADDHVLDPAPAVLDVGRVRHARSVRDRGRPAARYFDDTFEPPGPLRLVREWTQLGPRPAAP